MIFIYNNYVIINNFLLKYFDLNKIKWNEEDFIKKLSYFIFISFILIVQCLGVSASNSIGARIGNKFFDTLEEAIAAAGPNDIISLTSNISLDEPMEISKTININLNNFTIQGKEKVFMVDGGSLNLNGNGTIRETSPNYGAIILKGSENPDKKDYTTVSVGSGVKLEGWSGIFIDHNEDNVAYGVLVNMNGKISAVDDINGGPGAGIYVNGNVKNKENAPVVNLSDTVEITSTGNGIYSAGYATYNIDGAYIEGKESGLGIKSGVFNILDGTIVGSGEDKTPTSGNNNGINPSGTAIQIESNKGYAGGIELDIKKGTILSKNSNAIYEYTVGSSETQVDDISLSGGKYVAGDERTVFNLSNSFKNNYSGFISGGEYSTDPTAYLKSGYGVSLNSDSMYEVTSSTISVFNEVNGGSSNNLVLILTIILVLLSGFFIYINRNKLFSLIGKR